MNVVYIAKAPKFTEHPLSQSFDLTNTASFTSTAFGDDINYQWTIGSGSLPSKVTGINTNTLVIPDVRSSDDNNYICTISNDGGSVTSNPAKLTVTGMTIKCYIIVTRPVKTGKIFAYFITIPPLIIFIPLY